MAYIHRELEEVIASVTKEYPVIIVTGSRQVGKTTMLQHLMDGTERNYVTLDDLSERAIAQSDPAMFLQLHKPPVLIDEVQYAPQLFSRIKQMSDRDKIPGAYWLTGSQTFRLMRLAGESLVGRACILRMSSLSQGEMYGPGSASPFSVGLDELLKRANMRTPADTPAMYDRIFKGSMPALASGEVSNRNLFYSSYLQTYIERDIRDISGDIDATLFSRFITAVACRAGQMLNYADISKDVDGMRSEKIKEWLGLMEQSGIIFYLQPYSNNLLKRTVSKPKLYFWDSGLVAYLTKWLTPESLSVGAMSGAILENYVVSEIIKTYYNAGEMPGIYYYRNNDAKEIDVILEADGQLHPCEIKRTATPGAELTRSFKVLDNGSVPRGMGAVLCMHDSISAIDSQTLIVPAWVI